MIKRNLHYGDLYKKDRPEYDWIGFTGNSTINASGGLVMGKGNAYSVRMACPGIAKRMGARIENMSIYHLIFDDESKFFALQTKIDYRKNSPISLVSDSLDKLSEFANANPNVKIALPIPGIGIGGLRVSDVANLINDLPQNIDVWVFTN